MMKNIPFNSCIAFVPLTTVIIKYNTYHTIIKSSIPVITFKALNSPKCQVTA